MQSQRLVQTQIQIPKRNRKIHPMNTMITASIMNMAMTTTELVMTIMENLHRQTTLWRDHQLQTKLK